jgi:glycosyltransferase 2 family protein
MRIEARSIRRPRPGLASRVAPLSSRRAAATLMPDRPREFDRKRLLRMAWPRWKRSAKLAVKTVLAVVVLWAVGRHVAKTWGDLQSHGQTLHVEPAWVVAAAALYLAGLTICGAFFGKVMNASPTPISAAAAIRAYLISHLGKYVPGKAMVVVMRVGLVAPHGARPATAAIATFYETLVMMAAGAIVAALGFGLGPEPVQVVPLGLALGLSALFLIVVDPLVFPRASKLVTTPLPNVGLDALPRITRRLLGLGLILTAISWVLLGLSQVAVVRAVSPGGIAPGLWPLVTASVALATVAGFVVAVLPAGLGVREGVLMMTLAPAIGDDDTAVVAALALRLTWVAAEAAAALVLVPLRPPLPTPAPLSEPDSWPSPTPGESI